MQTQLLTARWQDASSLPSTPFQQTMLAVIYLVGASAFLLYCLRMYTRFVHGQIAIEDWLISAAMLIDLAYLPVTYYYFKYSYAGFPSSEIPEILDPTPELLWTWISGLLYNPILALVKTSALVFMYRIAGHLPSVRWSVFILIFINISAMVATFLVVIFQTIPVAAYWNLDLEAQRSINAGAFGMSSFILTIVTDLLVLAIPCAIFLKLNMSLATKLGLTLVFLTSGLVTAIGILRVVAFGHFFFTVDYDFTNTWGPSYSAIEPNLAIIAACIPFMRRVLRQCFPHLFSSSRRNGALAAGPYEQHHNAPEARLGLDSPLQLQSFAPDQTSANTVPISGNIQEDTIVTPGIVRTTTVRPSARDNFWHSRSTH